MSRWLYREASSEPKNYPSEGHAGLWFDKFCNTWRNDDGCPSMSAQEKLPWIKSVTKEPVGDRRHIGEYARRQARMANRLGGCFAVFSNESRFVTGLGRSHPIENGFAWHPILGTPYLPGSSIKGLLRAWARHGVEPSVDVDTQNRIFGKPGRVGGVCFHDAVPTGPMRLAADVMTPHYAGWTFEDPPGDWRSPTLIPFLVTAENAHFLFSFTQRPPLDSDDLDVVFGWLREALEWGGGGSKTAVGYGRFHHDEKETTHFVQALKEEEIEKTPEGRWHLKIKGRSEAEVLELVRLYLEKERLTDSDERQAFARAVSTRYRDWVDSWHRGVTIHSETNVGRKKLKERARLLDAELLGSSSC